MALSVIVHERGYYVYMRHCVEIHDYNFTGFLTYLESFLCR